MALSSAGLKPNMASLETLIVSEAEAILSNATAMPSFTPSAVVVAAADGWHWHWHWHWSFILYAVVVWQILFVAWRFWWKAPSNIIIAAYPTPLGRYWTALRMIFDSPSILQAAYQSANGKPFAVPMTDRWIVFVSDRGSLQKLEGEPEYVLSMEEALHELALTAPILGHLQVPAEKKGPKSEAFRVMVGVLKNKLRANLPAMHEVLKGRVREVVDGELAAQAGKSDDGTASWQRIRLMPALLRILTRVNLLVFVGDEQADRQGVYDDVMEFFWSCARAFPIFSFMPRILVPLFGRLTMGWALARQRVYELLHWMTVQTLEGDHVKNEKAQAHDNITQWSAKMARGTDSAGIARITIGLLFASAFQIPLVVQYCIYCLCKHHGHQQRLRAEALEYRDGNFGSNNQEMPYLDSFIKECGRLGPGIILSAPRQVMVPYTSPEGYHVPSGNWIAIPQISVMRDEKVWPQAMEFDGFRFVDTKNDVSESRLTHPSYDYPFWGSIRHACPARFYVSVVMKLILSQLLLDYEFELDDPNVRPYLDFGRTRLPSPFLTLRVRRRQTVADSGSTGIVTG